ncbi:nucleolar pre-ribosomal-associated protein 1 [Chytridiales sp. JEL 0842]|nr:nucleolar pre-ribosomal-associated protein 1 [Chytridiales sp. JEL 0842]
MPTTTTTTPKKRRHSVSAKDLKDDTGKAETKADVDMDNAELSGGDDHDADVMDVDEHDRSDDFDKLDENEDDDGRRSEGNDEEVEEGVEDDDDALDEDQLAFMGAPVKPTTTTGDIDMVIGTDAAEGQEDAADDDEDREEQEAARKLSEIPIITLKEFLQGLSSENVEVMFKVLTRFSYSLKRLVTGVVDYEVSPETELIKAYVKHSPEFVELIRVWHYQQENEITRLESVALDVLAYAITATRLIGSRSVGTAVVRSIMRGNMKPVYRNLSSRKHTLMQSTLRLLVALATQSSSTTKELFDTFNFTLKALPTLLNIRKKAASESAVKSRRPPSEDIRTLYIRFLLAFIMFGDVTVRKAILETKGAVSGIFKGMWEDTYETVEFLFSVLRRKVVDDQTLSRTSKATFFNNYVLEQITKLYSRSDTEIPTNIGPDGTSTVADVVHTFLMHLCTKPGSGICYEDLGWFHGIVKSEDQSNQKTGRFRNTVLLRWAGFLRPTEIELEKVALLELLRNCPELVQPYWTSQASSLSFEPRLSSKWLTNMAFATQVISLPPPDLVKKAKDSAIFGLTPSVSVMIDNILPPQLSKGALGRALQHSSPTVRHAASIVLAVCLEKLESVQKELERLEETQIAEAEVAISDDAKGWSRSTIRSLRDEIKRRVPDVQIIIAFQNNLAKVLPVTPSKKSKKEDAMEIDDDQIMTGVVGVVPAPAAHDFEEDPDVTQDVLQSAAMRLLRLYQIHFNDLMLESGFDYGKLLPQELSLSNLEAEIEAQKQLLELLLEVPAFKWWNHPAGSKSSHLATLLKFYILTPNSHMRKLTGSVITRCLSDTFLFKHHADEIIVWLEVLHNLPSSETLPALPWIDEAMCSGIRGPYRLVDKLTELTKAVLENLTDQERKVYDHSIEVRLSMRQLVPGVAKDDEEALSGTDSAGQFPFSPALVSLNEGAVAMLKKREFNTDNSQMIVITKLLAHIMMSVFWETQPTSAFLSYMIKKALETLDPANLTVRTAFAEVRRSADYYRVVLAMLEKYSTSTAKRTQFSEAEEDKSVVARWKTLIESAPTSTDYDELFSITLPASLNPNLPSLLALDGKDLKKSLTSFIGLQHPHIRSCFDQYTSISPQTRLQDLSTMLPRHLFIANLLRADLTSLSKENLSTIIRNYLLTAEFDLPIHLPLIARHLVLEASFATTSSARKMAIKLLRMTLDLAFYSTATTFDIVRELVFRHPFFLESFFGTSAEASSTKDTVLLVSEFISRDSQKSKKRQLHSTWKLYLNMLRETILYALHTSLTDKSSSISSNVLDAFESMRNFMETSDIDEIIEAVLSCKSHLEEGSASSHSKLLSLAVTSFDKTKGSVRRITSQMFRHLLDLMRTIPSNDLDTIFEAAVCGSTVAPCIQGNSKADHAKPRFMVVETAKNGLPIDLSTLIDSQTLTLLVTQNKLSHLRALRHLLLANQVHRCWAVKNVSLFSGLSSFVLLEAFLLCYNEGDIYSHSLRGVIEKLSEEASYIAKTITTRLLTGSSASGPYDLESVHVSEAKVLANLLKSGIALEIIKSEFMNLGDLDLATFNESSESTSQGFCHYLASYESTLLAFVHSIETDEKQLVLFASHLLLLGARALTVYFRLKKKFEPSQESTEEERRQEGLVKTITQLLMTVLEFLATKSKSFIIAAVDSLCKEGRSGSIKSFIIATLKYRFACGKAMKLLQAFVKVIYATKSGQIIPSSELVNMISTHSQFDSIMILEDSSPGWVSEARSAVVQLLSTLILLDPKQHTQSNVLSKLSLAYQGTLSTADRCILSIWRQMEKECGISMARYTLKWGPQAAMDLSKIGGGAVGNISAIVAAECLASIDANIMMQTIEDVTVESDSHTSLAESSKPLYDVDFMLPLITSCVVLAGDRLDTKKLVESNALGLAAMALANKSDDIRKVGYFILSKSTDAIRNAADLKEKDQVLLVLSAFQNSIIPDTSETPRIPTIVALFVAKSLSLMCKPDHFMYPLVNQFMLKRPFLDVEDVPMFYTLLNSSSDDCRRERVWLFRMLSSGLRCEEDYRLYKRRHVVDLMLGFMQSAMADSLTRKLTFELLFKLSKIPSVLVDLVTRRGLLAFLTTCVNRFHFAPTNEVALPLLRLLNSILSTWISLDDDLLHPEKKNLWLGVFSTTCHTTLAKVLAVSPRMLGAADKEVWLSNAVVESLQLYQSLALLRERVHEKVQDPTPLPQLDADSLTSAINLLAQLFDSVPLAEVPVSNESSTVNAFEEMSIVHKSKPQLLKSATDKLLELLTRFEYRTSGNVEDQSCSVLYWILNIVEHPSYWESKYLLLILEWIQKLQEPGRKGLLGVLTTTGREDLLARLLTFVFHVPTSSTVLESTPNAHIQRETIRFLAGLTTEAITSESKVSTIVDRVPPKSDMSIRAVVVHSIIPKLIEEFSPSATHSQLLFTLLKFVWGSTILIEKQSEFHQMLLDCLSNLTGTGKLSSEVVDSLIAKLRATSPSPPKKRPASEEIAPRTSPKKLHK